MENLILEIAKRRIILSATSTNFFTVYLALLTQAIPLLILMFSNGHPSELQTYFLNLTENLYALLSGKKK